MIINDGYLKPIHFAETNRHNRERDALGELSRQQFETRVKNRTDDEEVSQYGIETSNQPGSQQTWATTSLPFSGHAPRNRGVDLFPLSLEV